MSWVRVVVLGVTVLLASLSGCTGPGVLESAAGDFRLAPPPEAFSESLDGENCDAALVIVPMTYVEAERWLPPGYRPRDVRDFFPQLQMLPETGRTGAFLITLSCESSEFDPAGYAHASLAIFVKAPNVPDVEASEYNLYEIAHIGSHTRMLEVLRSVGWDLYPADINLTVSVEGDERLQAFRAQAFATESEPADLYRFSVLGQPPFEYSGVSRFWHNLPQGVGYFEYEFNLDLRAGPVDDCFFRQGTPMAAIAGMGGCPASEMVGAVVVDVDPAGTLRFLPGVRVG